MLRGILGEWLSWVYPCVCEQCGRGFLDGVYLCPDCERRFKRIEPPYCVYCGEPAEGSFAPGGLCRHCAEKKPYFQEARAPYINTGELRELILSFKYAGQVHLGRTFAELMANALRAHPHWFGGKERLLVPVPMHWGKMLKRRYNQAAELAVQLHKITGYPYADVLKRLPDARSQASMGREERLRHARKIYTIHQGRLKRHPVRDCDVLLIDDVFTTGATANTCARLLKRAGAKSVCVLTIARTHRLWHG